MSYSIALHITFDTGSLSEPALTTGLEQLASKPRGPSHLCFPRAGITGVCLSAQFL